MLHPSVDPGDEMLSVFLSYARVDAPAIEQLAMDLRALGCAPWFDSELAGGADWWRKILAKIREANVFVFATSNASLESPACLTEFAYARAVHRRTVPVLVGDGVSMQALPPDLAVLHQVDYRRHDKNALIALARCLLQLDPERPLPVPLPEEPKVPLSYLGELREEVDASSLTFDAQSALVLRIHDLFRTGKGSEVLDVALRFRRRRDLFSIVAENLDEVIAKFKDDRPGKERKSSRTRSAGSSSENDADAVPDIPLGKLQGKSYAMLRTEFSDAQLMATLDIVHDGRKYRREGDSFYFLADAVEHALAAASAPQKP
jgi:hypothetical protein